MNDLRLAWGQLGREAHVRRDLAVAAQQTVRSAFVRWAPWRAVEVVAALALLFAALAVAVPRGVSPAGAGAVLVAFYAFGWAWGGACSVLAQARVDVGASLLAAQCAVERARWREFRLLQWTLFGGVLLWLPIALVLLDVVGCPSWWLFASARWWLANALLGLGVLGLGRVAAVRVERAPDSPFAQRVLDALTGSSLRAARKRLAELDRFRDDAPSADTAVADLFEPFEPGSGAAGDGGDAG